MTTFAEESKNNQPSANTDALINALEALQPNTKDLQKQAFKKAYPIIVKKLAIGVKKSKVIALLKEQGIPLAPVTFKKWMEEMEMEQKGKEMVRNPLSGIAEEMKKVCKATESEQLK